MNRWQLRHREGMLGTVLQSKPNSKASARRAYSEMWRGKVFCAMWRASPGKPRQRQASRGSGKCLFKANAVGDTSVSTLRQTWADPSPPLKGAQPRQALHTQVCSTALFPAHGWSCRRVFKSNSNYQALKKAKACFSILSTWSWRCLMKNGIAVLAVHFMKASLQKTQK